VSKKVWNILLSGLGGQGILFMARVLAEAAIKEGYFVRGAETHGMAQRGGSVVGHLRIGDVESSLVREGGADVLLSLDEIEAYRNLNYLAPSSVLCVNTKNSQFPREEVRGFLTRLGVKVYGFDALGLALSKGIPQSVNLALVGYLMGTGALPIQYETIRSVVEGLGKKQLSEKNLELLEQAFQMARSHAV
jgi:indolepyruvate ferredoxin oxidoreductase beta subunit